jgi:F-type H+-transporting ATPase subunit gamma
MPSARDIRRRIKSVKNIQQITKAMKMVAAARLRRAQEAAIASRPYTEKIRQVLANVTHNTSDGKESKASKALREHPLLQVRPVENVGYLLISADKGLAGAYSSNLFREVLPYVRGQENVSLMAVGRKTRDYFKRRAYKVDEEFIGFSEKPTYQHAKMLAKIVAEKFMAEENAYDEIYLAYTFFNSPINLKPTIVKLLPIGEGGNLEAPEKPASLAESEDEISAADSSKPASARKATITKKIPGGYKGEPTGSKPIPFDYGSEGLGDVPNKYPEPDIEYIFTPTPDEVLDRLLPKYLEVVIYNALLQSAASELGARMTAMGSATDNAQELISQLTLNYNKVRQATITREISEIVGGAEALK